MPWAFMTAFWFISPGLCLVIRFYLKRENDRRMVLLEQSGGSDEENEVLDAGSQTIMIDDDDLDRTDRENLKFIYPL